jgi:hypothetical protein
MLSAPAFYNGLMADEVIKKASVHVLGVQNFIRYHSFVPC